MCITATISLSLPLNPSPGMVSASETLCPPPAPPPLASSSALLLLFSHGMAGFFLPASQNRGKTAGLVAAVAAALLAAPRPALLRKAFLLGGRPQRHGRGARAALAAQTLAIAMAMALQQTRPSLAGTASEMPLQKASRNSPRKQSSGERKANVRNVSLALQIQKRSPPPSQKCTLTLLTLTAEQLQQREKATLQPRQPRLQPHRFR